MSDELTNHQVSADILINIKRQYSLTLDEGNIPCPLIGGIPLTKYGQRWEIPLPK